jgi:hypothetical protein
LTDTVRASASSIHELVAATLRLIEHNTELERGVSALISEVLRLREAVATTAAWQRRDLSYAADIAAVTSSAAFVQAELPRALAFGDPRSTLHHATSLVSIPGLALEFGVATGSTLSYIVSQLPEHRVCGFDVFTGLPEDWRTGFPAGMFAQAVPEVPGAEIVNGLFADSLPAFMADNQEQVAFLHLDADLYSSTVTVLKHVGPRLRPGSIVIFDEYFNYPSWQDHEHKAWREFVDSTQICFNYEGYTANNEQLVLRITEPPQQ